MIYEIIERENYYEYINPDKVIFPKYNGIENLKPLFLQRMILDGP